MKVVAKWMGVVVAMLALGASGASASGFSVFGSYLSLDDPDEAFGAGLRYAFDLSRSWDLDLTTTYYSDADFRLRSDVLLPDDEIRVVPFDLGFTVRFGDSEGLQPYLGFGGSFVRMRSKRGEFDDVAGGYVRLGFEVGDTRGPRFFAEAMGRFLEEGNIKFVIDESDQGIEIGSEELSVDAWSANAGVVWRFP